MIITSKNGLQNIISRENILQEKSVDRNSGGYENTLHFWVIHLEAIENECTDPQSFEH